MEILNIKNFVYITDNSYTVKELIEFEANCLTTLNF
ncbi:MAG: hypothetical protein ACK52J_04355 [bacterium]